MGVYMYHQIQFDLLRVCTFPIFYPHNMLIDIQSQAKWPSREDLYKAVHPNDKPGSAGLGSKSLYGKTAGFLVSP